MKQMFYFEIYNVKSGREYRDFRFTPAVELASMGLAINPANYEQVYASILQNVNCELTDRENLDFLFQEFNTDRPDDFFGHSMSTSDIVRLFPIGTTDTRVRAFFCDPEGWIGLCDDVMRALPLETRPEVIRMTMTRISDSLEEPGDAAKRQRTADDLGAAGRETR